MSNKNQDQAIDNNNGNAKTQFINRFEIPTHSSFNDFVNFMREGCSFDKKASVPNPICI